MTREVGEECRRKRAGGLGAEFLFQRGDGFLRCRASDDRILWNLRVQIDEAGNDHCIRRVPPADVAAGVACFHDLTRPTVGDRAVLDHDGTITDTAQRARCW